VDGQPIGTVLRFGAVYGARIKGNYERLVNALALFQSAMGKIGAH
jgi:UDP-glucose 4-epimerase